MAISIIQWREAEMLRMANPLGSGEVGCSKLRPLNHFDGMSASDFGCE